MPEATVTVKNVNTGLTQTVKTSADGVYNVLYLPAGDYTVTTEKAGFRKAETSGVGVHVATVSNIDVTLAVGGVDQSVEVTAAAPLLDVQGTNLGKIIPKNAIRDSAVVYQWWTKGQPGFRGSDAGSDRRQQQPPHRRRTAGWPE